MDDKSQTKVAESGVKSEKRAVKSWREILAEANNKNAVEAELETLKFWQEQGILEKSIENRSTDKNYTFYDGPITANGEPHYGHTLTMALKDVMPRYWTMRGYRVDRSLGWDCQGIPVEYEVEKALKFTKKEDIEEYGIEKFIKLCRESVERYQGDIRQLTARMGRLVNRDEEFATMDAKYIESVWWSLKELYNKDLLYLGYKVVPYSTRAGTPLSNSEVSLGGYSDIVDPAVFIKFFVPKLDAYAVAWTTTPWTLPGNLLLAVNSDAKYAVVEHNGEKLIVATELIEQVLGENLKPMQELKGSELVDVEYEPLFNNFADRKGQGAFKFVAAGHVELTDGSGIVHQAPYGEEDFELMRSMGIEMFDYLDEVGHFTEQVPEYAGLFYKQANSKIIEDLKAKGALLKHEDYTHSMPMCWRTNTPLIYKPIKSWYVRVTKVVDQLVKENNEINWMPDHVKAGRFGNWLEGARDWALSRNRYWGTPLPVWMCEETGEMEVIGSFAELEEKSGVKIDDPHKPYVDEITYKSPKGGVMKRVPEVIDVWYDSGAMPFARFHYPFENKERFEKKFPAQFIAEGVDQTRGWFYTLHVLGVALFGSKAFENVVVNGMALAADGTKMSKSKKNYTPVNDGLEMFGADVMRMFFLSSPIVRCEEVAFGDAKLKDTNASVFFPLWNSLKYFLNYADLHNWEYSGDLGRKFEAGEMPKNRMDVWVLTRLLETAHEVNEKMSAYDIQRASLANQRFIEDLSKWYIRRSRDRFVDGDKEALDTLHYVLVQLSKLLAPFIPFMSERIYQALVALPGVNGALESVHLEDMPEFEGQQIDYSYLDEMEKVRQLSSLGLKIRDEQRIKVRQPLATAYGDLNDPAMVEIVLGELNVRELKPYEAVDAANKSVVTAEENGVKFALDTTLTDELIAEGRLNELTRQLQVARKEAGCALGDEFKAKFYTSSDTLAEFVASVAAELKGGVNLDLSRSDTELEGGFEIKFDEGSLSVKIER